MLSEDFNLGCLENKKRNLHNTFEKYHTDSHFYLVLGHLTTMYRLYEVYTVE